jgi:hypothetical protein
MANILYAISTICPYKNKMLIIINCFTVSVTFLILQILSKSSTRMVMKVGF